MPKKIFISHQYSNNIVVLNKLLWKNHMIAGSSLEVAKF
jgi:hypothetical protein